jgi:hypothetical protein
MKILTTILTCSSSQERADACLATWLKDVNSPHEYYFYGSKTQSEKMDKTWNCEPDGGEARFKLPKKTYKMLVKSLNYDWDFLFKCDDDTFVAFDRLINLLKNYDPNDALYIGARILNPPENRIGPLRNLQAYAQGGSGYVLSRSAVQECVNASEIFLTSPRSEDRTLGCALKEQGINLVPTKLLSTPDPHSAKKNQSVCVDAIIKNDKITTHYVMPETMRTIYNHNK